MLRLIGVLLSCGALCLATPVPPAVGIGCPTISLIQEALSDVGTLKSKGGSTPLNNTMEVGGNVTTYLEGFIEALKSSKRPEERQMARKLQKIQDIRKPCPRWTEEDWKPEKQDFFNNLEDLLRFMKHNTPSEESA